jgi:hypothetical protein
LRIFTPAVWWAGNAALGVLLYRGLRRRLAREYPVFYGYAAYVLCSSLVLFRLSLVSRQAYSVGHWALDFVAVLFGVGVTWEIYDTILAGYSGVRRVGRSLIASLVLILLAKFVANLATQPVRVLFPTTVELARNLRFGQAALLLAILSLLVYYRIPLGRNVASLLYGYTLFIATAVVNLTLRSALGSRFQPWWAVLQPLAYLVILGMWCVGMWSREANPVPSPELEQDYAHLSRQTIAGMARMRARLLNGLRS